MIQEEFNMKRKIINVRILRLVLALFASIALLSPFGYAFAAQGSNGATPPSFANLDRQTAILWVYFIVVPCIHRL